jgi:hypothetical protein
VADRRGPAFHDAHDLELVARAAAGDLAAGEATNAHALLAACDRCAELAADLRAIAAATRRLPSAATALSATPPGIEARDFRLTEADAARLRRRGFLGIRRLVEVIGSRSRGLGGALAAFGLVGLLVAAGMPSLLGGAGGAATTLAPTGEGLIQKEAASEGAASAAPAAAPIPSDTSFLAATADPAGAGSADAAAASDAAGTDASRAAAGSRDDGADASSGWSAVALAMISVVVLVVGLNLLLAGRNGRRAGP